MRIVVLVALVVFGALGGAHPLRAAPVARGLPQLREQPPLPVLDAAVSSRCDPARPALRLDVGGTAAPCVLRTAIPLRCDGGVQDVGVLARASGYAAARFRVAWPRGPPSSSDRIA